MKVSNVRKLYLSNFLTGLVFWYGIEKIFMRSIGIDAAGIGLVTALMTVFLVIFDIPAGLLADKWSRKGTLIISAVALALCSAILGLSHGMWLYAIGDIFYAVYVVTTSGTYQAIIYDTLHEEQRSSEYSKVMGRAYALFMVGAGVGNIASGYIAVHLSYRDSYFLSVVPCLLNIMVMLTMREPNFHKALQKLSITKELSQTAAILRKVKLLRVLTVVSVGFAVIELFKLEFGQLYMLRYIAAPQLLGILWALYAFAIALGSVLAHRLRAHLSTLIILSVAPLLLMAFIDSRFSIALFMVQAVAGGALINQIETRVQENTPSNVRASILSVLSTFGRVVSVPASLGLGYIFREYNAFVAVRVIAAVGGLTLLYWLIAKRGTKDIDAAEVAEISPLAI